MFLIRYWLLIVILIYCAVPLIVHSEEPESVSAERVRGAVQPDSIEKDKDPRDGFDLSIGFGISSIELTHGDFRLHFSRYFSMGVGFGGFPADVMINDVIRKKDLRKLDSEYAAFESLSDTSFVSLSGYARLKPFKRAFFIEYAFELWRVQARINGVVGAKDIIEDPADVQAKTVFTIPINGFNIGWCFLTKPGFYFEILVGLGFPAAPRSDVNWYYDPLDTSVPHSALINQHIEEITEEANALIRKRSKKFEERYPYIFNFGAQIGWAFDLSPP